jgi:hypothetical protein
MSGGLLNRTRPGSTTTKLSTRFWPCSSTAASTSVACRAAESIPRRRKSTPRDGRRSLMTRSPKSPIGIDEWTLQCVCPSQDSFVRRTRLRFGDRSHLHTGLSEGGHGRCIHALVRDESHAGICRIGYDRSESSASAAYASAARTASSGRCGKLSKISGSVHRTPDVPESGPQKSASH